MSDVGERRQVAAAEIARLRERVENEVGRPARWYRWSRPLAAALGGVALAFAVRRVYGVVRRQVTTGPREDERDPGAE